MAAPSLKRLLERVGAWGSPQVRLLRVIQACQHPQGSGTKISSLWYITKAIPYFPCRKPEEICEHEVISVAFSILKVFILEKFRGLGRCRWLIVGKKLGAVSRPPPEGRRWVLAAAGCWDAPKPPRSRDWAPQAPGMQQAPTSSARLPSAGYRLQRGEKKNWGSPKLAPGVPPSSWIVCLGPSPLLVGVRSAGRAAKPLSS